MRSSDQKYFTYHWDTYSAAVLLTLLSDSLPIEKHPEVGKVVGLISYICMIGWGGAIQKHNFDILGHEFAFNWEKYALCITGT